VVLVDQMAGAAVHRSARERTGEAPAGRGRLLDRWVTRAQTRVEIGGVGGEVLREAGFQEQPLPELDGGRLALFFGFGRALTAALVGGLRGRDPALQAGIEGEWQRSQYENDNRFHDRVLPRIGWAGQDVRPAAATHSLL
jgi:hypothetical protein